jgi:hypothetical protein
VCGDNYVNNSNYSVVCACYPGNSGINCGVVYASNALIAGLAAGAVAGIILAALIALGIIAGGGALAAANAVGGEADTGLFNNPLYEGAGSEGVNPLHG